MIIIKPDGMNPNIRDKILEECKIFGDIKFQRNIKFSYEVINFLYPKLLDPSSYFSLSNTIQYLYKNLGYLVVFESIPDSLALGSFKKGFRERFGNTIFGNCLHTPDADEILKQIEYFSREYKLDTGKKDLNLRIIWENIDDKKDFFRSYMSVYKLRKVGNKNLIDYCREVSLSSDFTEKKIFETAGELSWDNTFESVVRRMHALENNINSDVALALAIYGIYGNKHGKAI